MVLGPGEGGGGVGVGLEFATLMKIWSQNGAFCHKNGENGGVNGR